MSKLFNLIIFLTLCGILFGMGWVFGTYHSYKNHQHHSQMREAGFGGCVDEDNFVQVPKHRAIDL